MFGKKNKFTQHIVMLGLNDKDTKTQRIQTVEAYKMARAIVAKYYDGATIYEAQGVYKHDDGTVVFENSLKIDIIVFDKGNDDIEGLTAELKVAFNQESIALQTGKVESMLV